MNIVIILFISILLSGFFSGSEIAFFSLSDAKVYSLKKSKKRGANLLSEILSNKDRLLITILIGNNLVNIGSSAITTYVISEQLGSEGVGIATGLLTFLILTFGEIVPKTIASKYAGELALYAVYPIYFLQKVLLPVTILFEQLSKLINNLLGEKDTNSDLVEDELKSMAILSHKNGDIEDYERDVINKVFKLNDVTARKVMTEVEDLFMLSGDLTLNESVDMVKSSHHSRIPLYQNNDMTDVVGFLYVRDMLRVPRSKWSTTTLREIMREAVAASTTDYLNDVYEDFIDDQVHIAFIYDSKKDFVGILTLEDIIEELLGEIEDETDVVTQENLHA